MQKPVPIFQPVTSTSLQDIVLDPSQVTGVFAPARPVAIVSRVTDNTLLQLQNNVQQLQNQMDSVANPSVTPPAIVQDLAATESPYKTSDGSLLSLVSVSFTDSDPNFASADIYITGYHGGSTAQFVTNGTESPISFLCETTKETVTLTVVSKDSAGDSQSIQSAPTTTVTLDGVTSPPPPPSIAQTLTWTAVGYSFSFNVEGGLLEDVIAGYNIYRNTTDTFTGSTQIQHIAQPTTNQGTIQVSDPLPQSTVDYYYWVTSVNTSGLESTPVSAGNATGDGIPQQVSNVSAVESPYKTSSGQMVSLVAVDFTPAANDPFYDSVEVYFTGYSGNPNPALMARGNVSPIQFPCETTHEVVTVTVVAVSANDVTSDFASAPTCTVALDGVTSAPPAPSIATAQVALAGSNGWQFSFNVIGGLEAAAGLVTGYRVYHSESNVTPIPQNNYYAAYPQPSTNVGQIVVQETTSDILFYWVSAYNNAGFESELTLVPFIYVDPGDPAPPTPAPVQTTKTYAPTTLLNGWGGNAHVGYWEPSDYNYVFGLNGSSVNAFINPSNAYDGNQSTVAGFSEQHTAQYGGCVWSFSNFAGLPSGTTVVSAQLSVISEVLPTSGPVHGQGSVWYSTDGGSTWTSIYTAISSQRLKQTDAVTLPTTIDPTKLQMMAFAHSHDDLAMNLYEVSLSITQQAPAGPEKVTGVTATLVGGDVQISWNALTPLSRTDILNYEVTRTVHGGGYAQSKVHDTITPNGSSTYSWTDTSAHDGTFDYWVVANNSTGSSQPSDVAHLGGAQSLIYTTGATIESLRPAQAGADVTGLNTAADAANLNGVASHLADFKPDAFGARCREDHWQEPIRPL